MAAASADRARAAVCGSDRRSVGRRRCNRRSHTPAQTRVGGATRSPDSGSWWLSPFGLRAGGSPAPPRRRRVGSGFLSYRQAGMWSVLGATFSMWYQGPGPAPGRRPRLLHDLRPGPRPHHVIAVAGFLLGRDAEGQIIGQSRELIGEQGATAIEVTMTSLLFTVSKFVIGLYLGRARWPPPTGRPGPPRHHCGLGVLLGPDPPVRRRAHQGVRRSGGGRGSCRRKARRR
jgi:hypothetical protein